MNNLENHNIYFNTYIKINFKNWQNDTNMEIQMTATKIGLLTSKYLDVDKLRWMALFSWENFRDFAP